MLGEEAGETARLLSLQHVTTACFQMACVLPVPWLKEPTLRAYTGQRLPVPDRAEPPKLHLPQVDPGTVTCPSWAPPWSPVPSDHGTRPFLTLPRLWAP